MAKKKKNTLFNEIVSATRPPRRKNGSFISKLDIEVQEQLEELKVLFKEGKTATKEPYPFAQILVERLDLPVGQRAVVRWLTDHPQ